MWHGYREEVSFFTYDMTYAAELWRPKQSISEAREDLISFFIHLINWKFYVPAMKNNNINVLVPTRDNWLYIHKYIYVSYVLSEEYFLSMPNLIIIITIFSLSLCFSMPRRVCVYVCSTLRINHAHYRIVLIDKLIKMFVIIIIYKKKQQRKYH